MRFRNFVVGYFVSHSALPGLFPRLVTVVFCWGLVAYFHREEKKKGKAGVLYIGGVFDVFWTLVESIPTGSQVANWLDRRFKKHEVDLKEQVENKHLQKHPHKHSHKHLHEQSTKGQVQSANFATTGVTNSGPEAQKKSQKSKSSKRRSKDSSQKHKHEHKKSGISSSQKNKSKSSKRKASVKLPTEKSQPVEQ
ncbi:hypothetical protein M3Y97_00109900 [Aphelenchoides bicaudatus]|nr:hypothetical protein M3Y97_00109900 [Aphelenchoides bicaudatus]